MLDFNKERIRESLTLEDIFQLLTDFGGEPQFTTFGILSRTICHHHPKDDSNYKLYYYENSKLFQCYSNCGNFDIFDLVIKVKKIQEDLEYTLNDAIRWVAKVLGIAGEFKIDEKSSLNDWTRFKAYEEIQSLNLSEINFLTLKEYDESILKKFNYNVEITPWLLDNISKEVMKENLIGYYPGADQITIPHFDVNNRFIGLRGRALCQQEAELYGKYRPIKIEKTLYNHPLGFNLYNLNKTKENIKRFKKVIIFESEKATLQYQTHFGMDNSIAVACCGSNLTSYQMFLLQQLRVEEVIVAFDKQYEDLKSEECSKWAKKLTQIHNKYKNNFLISFIWDKENVLKYKSSPIDEEKEKFLYLFKERIVL